MLRLDLPVGVLIFSSCLIDGIFDSGARDDLTANLQTWLDAEVSSYEYRLERSCFCFPVGPADITVVDGEIVSIFNVLTDEQVDPSNFGAFETIESLFARIEDAMRRGAHRLDVSYDEIYGFPTRIDIDYIENAADDEILLLVSSFSPTPPN